MLVASVAVEKTVFSFDRLFSYFVPEKFYRFARVGCVVFVPFGASNNLRQGVILKIEKKDMDNLKYIEEIAYEEFIIEKETLDLARFLHSTCFCSWFGAIKTVVPVEFFKNLKTNWKLVSFQDIDLSSEEVDFINKLKKNKNSLNYAIRKFILQGSYNNIIESLKKKKILVKTKKSGLKSLGSITNMVRIVEEDIFKLKLTKKQNIVFEYLKDNGEMSFKQVCYFCGVTEVVLKNLEKLGLVEIFEKEVDDLIYYNFEKTKNINDLILNEEQEAVKNGIIKLIKKNSFEVALLRGVTGSGKTYLFLKLIDYVLKKGKDVIVMVPEISLTVQTVSFFRSFFGSFVFVVHSGIKGSRKIYEYRKMLETDSKIVVGTRSAVFAPCKNLGLIIMDEEGGACYKSSEMSPRYDAREVAKYRCFKSSSLLLLSSATPSVETNYFAENGTYKKFFLNNRYRNIKLPKVFLVDISKSKMSLVSGITEYLFEEIVENFKKKEQTIIFLNRRGYYLTAVCLDCTKAVCCKNCSTLMVYHKVNDCFICHYCGYIKKKENFCSFCGSRRISFCGQGTQNIEYNLKKNIKAAKILRLDSDSVFNMKVLEEKIKSFENGEYDILIGTQMVAKGLNFLNVSLVGVVGVDNILYGADFKSSERAFSILTQVIGRSGRAKKVGKAIIQTMNPQSKIISWAAKQDYDLFYRNEIEERKEFFCPPFCDIFIVNFVGPKKEKLVLCAKEFICHCKIMADENIPFVLLGISTPYIECLNRKYRKRIIIKSKNCRKFREWLKKVALRFFSYNSFLGVRVNIDINGDII